MNRVKIIAIHIPDSGMHLNLAEVFAANMQLGLPEWEGVLRTGVLICIYFPTDVAINCETAVKISQKRMVWM